MPEAATESLAQAAHRLDKLYEFERAPVTPDKLHSGRYFAGLFAGEHVAATEFVIGALFVAWGAGARDLILGLLLGNALAVLSWALICAPIAVQTRLTLYWYVRRIVGPGLTVVYNVFNGLLYCFLASAMIGVSASAVILGLTKLGVHVTHPELTDVYPNSFGWVVITLAVGAVVVVLAILGFKKLSQFAGVCAPWMFLIFIAGALAVLPRLGEFRSLSELWVVLDTQVFTGQAPPGETSLGFWHIVFFAWFCNLAMHVGLSDMAIFRYARHWTYGFYSAFGMYLGHYVAWVCAGIMGAAVASGLNPGEMADTAAGMAGVVAVLIAGWTTANPTIYRAGLALQIATPNWPRWAVTILAGGLTTVAAFFPVIFMRLLDFVAIYGLSLMPIGAVIFAEHWLLPRLGMRQYWAERRGVLINMPALITWVAVLLVAFPLAGFTNGRAPLLMDLLGLHLFFRWLPAWFLAVILYIVLCKLWPTEGERKSAPRKGFEVVTPGQGAGGTAKAGEGAGQSTSNRQTSGAGAGATGGSPGPKPAPAGPPISSVTWAAGGVAIVALLFCLALPLRVFLGGSEAEVYDANLADYKAGLLIATVAYFIAAIFWTTQRERARSAAE